MWPNVFWSARPVLLLAATSLTMLSACSPRGGVDLPTQVVARVGSSEISMLQFNLALKSVGVPTPGEPLRREVAAKLVDRELAVQQALANKLDRQPEVLLQLEEARRDVLARAYADQTAAAAAKPGDNEAARYFAQHPELFAERKIYRLREAALPGDMKELPEVRSRLANKQPLEQVLGWLREQKVPFNEQVVIRAAEQLPIESLPALNAAAEGQTVLFVSPRGVIAYKLLAVQPAGVSWDAARPIVRDYLARQSGKLAVEADMQHLRGTTRVMWQGDFAQLFSAPMATVQ
ncbi:MAG: peptidyl-prolyl cis-trans isomerase, EpsD family [Betaproteobacteria bacterium]|nr:peptidyl-prolyl cis-trans isomerase, EpsD family [Betaproteobacteria bacterium]